MFNIKGIDHIVLRTTNPDKMIAFYCDLLGCNIENKQPDIGLTQLRAGNNLIDLVEVNTPIEKQSQNLEHFCLRINPFDYDSLKQYFQSHNIEIRRHGERYGAQGMGYSFYLDDPEGNEIELCEAKL